MAVIAEGKTSPTRSESGEEADNDGGSGEGDNNNGSKESESDGNKERSERSRLSWEGRKTKRW